MENRSYEDRLFDGRFSVGGSGAGRKNRTDRGGETIGKTGLRQKHITPRLRGSLTIDLGVAPGDDDDGNVLRARIVTKMPRQAQAVLGPEEPTVSDHNVGERFRGPLSDPLLR